MSGIAGAIAGAAVVTAGATIYGANQASNATQDAANTAAGVQRDALAQQATLSAPYRALGESAIPTLENLLGIGKPGGPSPEQTLQNTPGYQFTKEQGLQATQNAATALGLGRSGNVLTSIDKFSTGLADQTYQQTIDNLMRTTGLGQAAAADQAANIGQSASNLGNIAMSNGATQAGITANEIKGITGSIGNAMSEYTTLQALQGSNTLAPIPEASFTGTLPTPSLAGLPVG